MHKNDNCRMECGVHNYARRTECFRCRAPRGYGRKLYRDHLVDMLVNTVQSQFCNTCFVLLLFLISGGAD